MDPHEKVSMDAEKIMSNSWDFEFMGGKNVNKTCSKDESPYYTFGMYMYIYVVKFHALPNRNNKRINMILYQSDSKYMTYLIRWA